MRLPDSFLIDDNERLLAIALALWRSQGTQILLGCQGSLVTRVNICVCVLEQAKE